MWLKNAVHKPLGREIQPRLLHRDIICVHTMVGYLDSTYRMFKQNGYGGTESHFGIGGKWGIDASLHLDGALWQFQGTAHTADANFRGNHRVLSIETADNAPKLPSQIVEWTPKQVVTLVGLVATLSMTYNIPPVLIHDTLPGRRGLAYHAQGVPPRLVKGGELWSAAGHECPGPVRINQFIHEVIPKVVVEIKKREKKSGY